MLDHPDLAIGREAQVDDRFDSSQDFLWIHHTPL
jgi:hypothetical protein